MNHKKYTKFVGDFETTIYEGQEYTEVWASALVEFYSDNVKVFSSIQDTIDYLKEIPGHVQVYYHNLKFDGEFWLSFLERNGYKKALLGDDEFCEVSWKKERDMLTNEYKYFISDRGLWYYIVIKTNKGFIELRDSMKLLPFSVEDIARDFDTKAKKLTMQYDKFRYAGCKITEDEKRYIANDVLIVKEALEIMEKNGNTRLTIGSCCFNEFRHMFSDKRFYDDFPNIYELTLNEEKYGSGNAGAYIRDSYHGGWCYVNKAIEGKTVKNGCVLDVNGLYSSVMHSNSGNLYPVGIPTFWKGNYIPEEALKERSYYFIRFKCRFYLKPGYLPFQHIKGTWLYKGSENLETSDIYLNGQFFTHYRNFEGEVVGAIPTLTMTMTDYALFLEHYNVEDFEILDGCFFDAKKGFFDAYIDKYAAMKENAATPAIRTESKLFLNNLYGKMATSPSSAFKVGEMNQDGSLSYYISLKAGRVPGYIPVGAAITSYAREVTIRAAQANYDTFCYADTDSIHCTCQADEVKGIEIDQKALGKWKHEADFEEARFIKQKTYIERNGQEFNIKCAGMPRRSKELFAASITRNFKKLEGVLTDEEKKFLEDERSIEDFKRGLKVPGRIKPKRIPGGVILVPCSFEIR